MRARAAIRPDARLVLTYGFARATELAEAQRLGVREVVLRPNSVAELGLLIHRLLSALASEYERRGGHRGSRTSFPIVVPDSSARWASATRSSAKVWVRGAVSLPCSTHESSAVIDSASRSGRSKR
jgi:hypothetical protein